MAASSAVGTWARIYEIVGRIPPGRVATYGQVALLAGFPGQARLVGYALNASKSRSLPWHRVVNARGEVSPRRDGGPSSAVQRIRLEREGVRFDARSRVSLKAVRWRPRGSPRNLPAPR